MSKKAQPEQTAKQRRRALAADVEAFLDAGNKIQSIPSGVSAQDPQGRGQPFRLGTPKKSS